MTAPIALDTPPQEPIAIKLTPIQPGGAQVPNEGEVALYNVAGHQARRMIDLQLHKVDLGFVARCLELLTHQHVTATIESEAIWTAAMVRFFKCFGSTNSGGRSQLSAKRVFRGEPAAAMVSFARLETLRNKTLVHDENSFMQGKLGVPIAVPATGRPRMGPLQFLSFVATTLDDESVSNLTLLTQCAIKWVDAEYAEMERALVEQLKEEKAATLMAAGLLTWTAPSHETAGQNKSAHEPGRSA